MDPETLIHCIDLIRQQADSPQEAAEAIRELIQEVGSEPEPPAG